MKYFKFIMFCFFVFVNTGYGQSLYPIGNYENNGEIEFCRIDVRRNKLFWPLGPKGLLIFDVSDPQNINRLKLYRDYEIRSYQKIFGSPTAIKVVGEKAFLAHGDLGFDILDLSNVIDPELIGRYCRNQSVYSFRIYKNYAILGLKDMGLEIIDFSNPNDIQMVARKNFEGLPVNSIDILDTTVYAACGHYGLKIVPFREPLDQFTSSGFPTDFNTRADAKKIQVYKGFGLLANDTRGISVLDLTLNNYPNEANLIETKGKANDLFIENETMYVATSKGVEIYNIESPESVFKIAGYTDKKRKFQKLTVRGKFLYATYKKGWWFWKKFGIMIFEIE